MGEPLVFGQWSCRLGCEAFLSMRAGCELAQRQPAQATAAGTPPAATGPELLEDGGRAAFERAQRLGGKWKARA